MSAELSANPSTPPGAPTCPACGAPRSAGALVSLWDGKSYCEACVDREYPALSEYARAHATFEDSMIYDRAAAVRAAQEFGILMLMALVVVAVVIVGAAGWDTRAVLVATGVSAAFFALVALLLPWLKLGRGASCMPTTYIHDGWVEVFRPNHANGNLPVVRFPLAEARWFMGTLRDDEAARGRGGVPIGRDPAIILIAPRKITGFAHPSRQTAVGSSLEKRELLSTFLRLARVSEGRGASRTRPTTKTGSGDTR
jgi:hypothetical protein